MAAKVLRNNHGSPQGFELEPRCGRQFGARASAASAQEFDPDMLIQRTAAYRFPEFPRRDWYPRNLLSL